MKGIHYLKNKSGEGHIDTGIKIIIGIVIGALILGGLYALFDNLVMPKLNAKVQDMMHYEEGASAYRYGATLSSLQYSYDGSTWLSSEIPELDENASVKKVLNTSEKDFSLALVYDSKNVYILKTEDNGAHWSIAYNAGKFSLDGKRVEYSLYQNQTGTFGMMVKVYDAPTGTSAIGNLYKSTDGRSWQRDGLPLVFF
ncbi:MAG: DUF6133 family protein [Eubacteriales bacterium]